MRLRIEDWFEQHTKELQQTHRRSVESAYKPVTDEQAVKHIVKHLQLIIETCRQSERVTPTALLQAMYLYKRIGAIPALRRLGMPEPTIDRQHYNRHYYDSKAVIAFCKRIAKENV